MNEKTELLLREVANKLGTTTEHLYTVLVKQARSEIIKSIITIIGMAVFALLMKVFLSPLITNKEVEGFMTFGAVVSLFFITIGEICSIVDNYINPEKFAIDYITQALCDMKD